MTRLDIGLLDALLRCVRDSAMLTLADTSPPDPFIGSEGWLADVGHKIGWMARNLSSASKNPTPSTGAVES